MIRRPSKIVSGGQTGVDRAALDVARLLNIPHGGWCPKGRLAEDGMIPDRYPLTETASRSYTYRTQQNVSDSDGTLIIFQAPLDGGTRLTYRKAVEWDKPVFLRDLDVPFNPKAIEKWMFENHIETLNIAGMRESGRPGIYARTVELLLGLWSE